MLSSLGWYLPPPTRNIKYNRSVLTALLVMMRKKMRLAMMVITLISFIGPLHLNTERTH